LYASGPRHARRIIVTAIIVALYLAWDLLSPNTVPSSNTLMLLGFFITLSAACRSALRWHWLR